MFFILSKVLLFLLNPLFWILILLLLAFFLKQEYWKKRSLKAAIIFFLFFSNGWISNALLKYWEAQPVPLETLSVPYDIGILLTGYTIIGAELPHDAHFFYYGNNANRLSHTIELYQKGIIQQILITGGYGYIDEINMSEAVITRDYLLKLGISTNDILIETKSRNTRENALFTAEYLKNFKGNKEKLLLITSASHMPRALKCYEKVGLKVQPFPVDYTAGSLEFSFFHLIPSAHAITTWQRLFKEWIGIIVYGIKGYI